MSEKTGADLKRENASYQVVRICGPRRAFRLVRAKLQGDCLAAAAALLLCVFLQVPAWGFVAVVMCVGVQLAFETLNTAVEAVVDLASPDIHPLAKRAKDCAAGAALIAACMSVIVGLAVYVPAALRLFGIA